MLSSFHFPRIAHAPLSIVSFALLGLWLLYMLAAGGAWLIEGNLHDHFMALSAAHFHGAGLQGTSLFHTSFGWIYVALQGAAWRLAMQFPSMDFSAVPLIGNALFGCAFIAMFALVRHFVKPWLLLPWWACAALLTLILTFRDLSLLPNPIRLLWYGPYNHHLWAWWMLQLLSVLGWQLYLAAEPAPPHRQIFLFACIQAVFLYVDLHYKISFFIAGGVLLASVACWMPWRGSARLFLLIGAMLGAALILSALAGVDYAAYGQDILPALRAKSDNTTMDRVNLLSKIKHLSKAAGGCFLFLVMRAWISGEWSLRRMMSDLLILASVWLASYSSFARVTLFFLLSAALLGLLTFSANGTWKGPRWFKDQAPRLLTLALWAALGSAVFFNLLAMIDLAWHRQHATTRDREVWAADRLWSEDRRPMHLWMHENHAALVLEDGIGGKLLTSVSPRPLGSKTWMPHEDKTDWNNRDYFSFVQEGQHLLAALRADLRETRIGSLEFANPFPMLAQARYPKDNEHWFHPGVTQSWKEATLFSRYYEGGDAMIVPVLGDKARQNLMNCHFYRWNEAAAEPYILAGGSPYALLFARRGWAAMRKIPSLAVNESDRAALWERCEALEMKELGFQPPL